MNIEDRISQAIQNPHTSYTGKNVGVPEKGYEDIYSDIPYIDADEDQCINGSVKMLLHVLYVPPYLRGQGIGTELFTNWLNALPINIVQIDLKSCSLGSGHTKAFWEKLGFVPAYSGCTDTSEGDATDILVRATNGHDAPAPIELVAGQTAHYIFGVESGL
jgi:hypothetical protein